MVESLALGSFGLLGLCRLALSLESRRTVELGLRRAGSVEVWRRVAHAQSVSETERAGGYGGSLAARLDCGLSSAAGGKGEGMAFDGGVGVQGRLMRRLD